MLFDIVRTYGCTNPDIGTDKPFIVYNPHEQHIFNDIDLAIKWLQDNHHSWRFDFNDSDSSYMKNNKGYYQTTIMDVLYPSA